MQELLPEEKTPIMKVVPSPTLSDSRTVEGIFKAGGHCSLLDREAVRDAVDLRVTPEQEMRSRLADTSDWFDGFQCTMHYVSQASLPFCRYSLVPFFSEERVSPNLVLAWYDSHLGLCS